MDPRSFCLRDRFARPMAALTILCISYGGLLPMPEAHAQWTFFGNDIVNTNSGNVGVGTAFPAGRLEVQGISTLELALDAVIGNPDFSLLENGNVKSQVKYLISDNGLSFFADDSHTGTGGLFGTPGMFLDGVTNDLTLAGTVQIRDDDRGRSGSVNGFNLTGSSGAFGTYIEDLHQSFDSSGIAFDGDAAGLWSPADTGNIVVFLEEDVPAIVAQVTAAGVFQTLSDRGVKRDVRAVSSEDALNRILELDGKRYKMDYNQENLDKGGAYLERDHLGFISQELEALFPEAVVTDENTGLKYIAYDMLIVPLVESIKALKAEIEALKAGTVLR